MTIHSWSAVFSAAAGACASLAGLIIVAMSVNVKTILGIPGMTSRAATTIGVLVLMVILAIAGLIPRLPEFGYGLVILICSIPVFALSVRSTAVIVMNARSASKLSAAVKGLLGMVPAGLAITAGILLVASRDTGLAILGAAIIVGIVASLTNAWVLLVEVLR